MRSQKDLIDALLRLAEAQSVADENLNRFRGQLTLAYRIRAVEETLLDLFSKAKVSGTVHTCIGQELTGVAIAAALEKEDWVTSNHRCHGHYIAKTLDWKSLIDELLGFESGASRGIGSSQHLYRGNFISNGTQGSLLPVASGVALYNKRSGCPNIAVSFIGEGTLGEGVVYETLNLGAVFQSPHLIVCENNYYSQSTPQSLGVAGSIEMRARAFGWEYFESNTWNLADLLAQCAQAVAFVRQEQRPAFLKIDTYRLKAHSKGDDDRDRGEVARFEKVDLLNRAFALSEFRSQFLFINSEVQQYVTERLTTGTILNYEEYAIDQLPRKYSNVPESVVNANIMLVKALNSGYRKQLEERGTYFVGEDILDPYGGAFKVTKGFSSALPKQVLSTSISEAGLVGLAIGIDLAGGDAIAEIMFGDFVVNAMDQLVNNASKFHHMYGKQFSCSVSVRAAMGGGRGYGPTHSQCLEKLLVGLDNVATLSVTSICDPTELIEAIAGLNCPKLILENKTDYTSYLFQPPDDLKLVKVGGALGTIKLGPTSGRIDIVIIAHGYLARVIADHYEQIFTAADVVFELVCPQLIHPFPLQHLARSLKRTSYVLIAEEGTENFGWASGIASQLVQDNQNVKVKTVSSDPIPIPSNRELERKNLISIDKIIKAIRSFRKTND